jgi:disulfide bond formation protein DsbB
LSSILTRAGLNRRTGNVLGVLACLGLIAYALFVQYGMHLEPCPLCILQRVSVITAGVLFLVAAVHDPEDRGAKVYGFLIDLATLSGIAIAARHWFTPKR